MKHGARNEFVGEIVEIKKGQLMCQVTLKVPAESNVCSVMTLDSLASLGIKEGDHVRAVIKAVNVLLTTE
ncbi:MAG: TOBE domain-containing protein [Phycisphaerae bacterium]|nr:TOBE domain-containing protein [Phycisphaerae bacterium]